MDQVVKEYVTELRKRLGSSMRQVLLFGSRARGSAREDEWRRSQEFPLALNVAREGVAL